MAFEAERLAFSKLKETVDNNSQLRSDIETALQQLLKQYNTIIRENRFIVGGVVEVILCTSLRAAGIEAADVGISEQRADIVIPQGRFSVKGHFSGTGNIRLINVLGESSHTEWDTATIFVLSGVGIGYADPELLPNAVRRTSDALLLRFSAIRTFLEKNHEYLIVCQVPSATIGHDSDKLVSRLVAREILKQTKILKEHLR
jgi:hypothetical protein